MNKSFDLTFVTARLLLKPCTTEDADLVLALLNSALFIQFVGDRNVRDLEAAKQYIRERMLPQMNRMGFGNYVIIRKSDSIKLGTCGLFDRPGLEGIDIGFGLLEPYHGKGYGYEASVCIRNAAFELFGIKLLRGLTVKENKASRGLLEKLGMHYVQDVRLPGDTVDLMLYELSFETFKGI